jgi:hypothetical protein
MERSIAGREFEASRAELVVMALALSLAAYGGYDYLQQRAAIESGVPVEATITAAGIEACPGERTTDYHPAVAFDYRYEGASYTGDDLRPGDAFSCHDRSTAASLVDPYTVGETTTAYVDPAAPDEAFLERERSTGSLELAGIGGLVFAVLLAAGFGVGSYEDREPVALRPADAIGGATPGPILGIDHERWESLAWRSTVGAFAVFLLSGFATPVAALATAEDPFSGGPEPLSSGAADPLGLAVLGLLGSLGALALSTLCHGLLSVRTYRRTRRRLSEPRPPSPFRRPPRLVSVLVADEDELGEYRRQVKAAGGWLAVDLFLSAVVLDVLGIGPF